MREWMREKMRRRSKRAPNDSEATGKIGQEIPANQPAPLRPSYEAAPGEATAPPAPSVNLEPDVPPSPLSLSPEHTRPFGVEPGSVGNAARFEIETQPES